MADITVTGTPSFSAMTCAGTTWCTLPPVPAASTWAWPIPTGAKWKAMSWDAILRRAATRCPASSGYDGIGSYSAPDHDDETEMQVGLIIHDAKGVMVYKATDTVNVGDYIKVPN